MADSASLWELEEGGCGVVPSRDGRGNGVKVHRPPVGRSSLAWFGSMKIPLRSVVAARSLATEHRRKPQQGRSTHQATPKEQHFAGFNQYKRWLRRCGHRLRWGGFNMVMPLALGASVAC
eukprot:scaffold17413_cov55-Cyclotella_meneghiniana.AAC.5